MYAHEETARRVIFESEDSDYSYWGNGSSFLLANSQYYYWITAAHVIDYMGGSAEALRIFPSDDSRISLPFNEKYLIQKDGYTDEEFKDIYILRIDLTEFEKFGDKPLTAQDLVNGLMPAEELSSDAELWIIGYPTEVNTIDYETTAIRSTRSVIRARYEGYSYTNHCHTARIKTSLNLSSFDGLSGSPVFFHKPVKGSADKAETPVLVGMLLRGTAESSIVHFVSSRVIGRLIQQAESDA